MVKDKKNLKESLSRSILDILIMVAVIVGLYYFLFSFVFSNETVSGPSMQPTFENNDRIITLRHFTPKRNEIVILKAPDQKNALYIKRIIGLPGEMVVSKNDKLFINGKEISQPYLNNHFARAARHGGELYTNNFILKRKIPQNCYFVLGDHRDVSKDSRYFGFVKRSAIVGEVKWRYWPLNQWRSF